MKALKRMVEIVYGTFLFLKCRILRESSKIEWENVDDQIGKKIAFKEPKTFGWIPATVLSKRDKGITVTRSIFVTGDKYKDTLYCLSINGKVQADEEADVWNKNRILVVMKELFDGKLIVIPKEVSTSMPPADICNFS